MLLIIKNKKKSLKLKTKDPITLDYLLKLIEASISQLNQKK